MKHFQTLFSLNENNLEIISLPTGQRKILTLNQFRLLECLMEGKGRKNEIMEYVWEENNIIVSDGSYHQLVFQTRQMLESIGLSARMIKTLPRHGLKLVRVETEQDAEDPQNEFITHLPASNEIDVTIAGSLRENEGRVNVSLPSIAFASKEIAPVRRRFLSRTHIGWLMGGWLGALLTVITFLSSDVSMILAGRGLFNIFSKSGGNITSQSLDENTIHRGLTLVDLWDHKRNVSRTNSVVAEKKGFMEDFVGYKYLCLYQSSKTDTNGLCRNYILIY